MLLLLLCRNESGALVLDIFCGRHNGVFHHSGWAVTVVGAAGANGDVGDPIERAEETALSWGLTP